MMKHLPSCDVSYLDILESVALEVLDPPAEEVAKAEIAQFQYDFVRNECVQSRAEVCK